MYKNYISLGNSGSTSPNNSLKSGVSTRFACLAAWQKKAFLLLFFTMFSFLGANAQVSVSGTTAGTTPVNYTTLNAAFTAINAGTHKGAITVLITANTTEPATAVPLLKSAGTSSYTAISIKPSGGNYTINSAASPTASKGVIILSGADNVTIDGDDTGTAGTQNLSIVVATNTTTGTAAIQLASNSTLGADGADNNTIKNCIITGGRSSATSTTVSYGIVMSNISLITTGAYRSINTTIQNNIITRAFHGVYAAGTSATYPNTGTQILNNTIGSATSASNIGSRGIYLTYSAVSSGGATISGNDIRVGDYGSTGYSATIAGIEIGTVNYGFTISGNNIHDINQPSSSGYGAHGIYITGATNMTTSTISNNFIRDVKMVVYQTSATSAFIPAGVMFTAGATGVSFVYNTIVMNAQLGSGANFSSFCVDASVSGVRFAQFQNNILVNNATSTSAYGLYTAATLNISGGTVNNNNYYVPNGNVGYYSAAARTTFSAWQTATSKDANGINVNPPFVSTTDLHINAAGSGASSFVGTAATGTGVTIDFDGQTRSVTGPDIGADEFGTAPSCAATPSPADDPTFTVGGVSQAPTLSWAATSGATSYDVYLNGSIVSTSQAGTSFAPGALSASANYTWQVVPKNAKGAATGCATWSFKTIAAVPTLNAGALTAFSTTCVGDTTAANTFTITAINLTSDITLAALSGYSYSETLGGVYTSTLTITPSSGSISTTIYVKFSPSAATTYSGNIVISGGGLSADVNVAASGTGVNPLGGTYTVGAGQTYTTLTAAVAAYNGATCFSGPVVFNLMDSTYSTSETFPIIINANVNVGTNTLTIKPNSTATITGAVASNGLIQLNGADYVIIDGSNNGTTSKNLTITNTSTTAATAVALISTGAAAGATNDVVKNCNISTGVITSGVSYGVALGGTTPGTAGSDNDNNTIQNNTITVATVGIYANGNAAVSALGMDNLAVTGNTVTTNSTLSTLAIRLGNATGNTVSQNAISVTTTASTAPVGLSLETGFVSSTVSRNTISTVITSATGGYGGRGITIGTGTASSNLTIDNNIIYGVNGSNWTGFTNSSSMGICIGEVGSGTSLTTTTGGVNLYYNSVNMSGSVSSSYAWLTAALYVGSGASALDVRNNIFVNSMLNTLTASAKDYAIYSAAANTAFTNINYNNYYGTVGSNTNTTFYLGNIGGTNRTDLTGIISGFGQNANSISTDPSFTPLSSYITNPLWPSVATTGTPVSVTTDILGTTRSGSTPSMGAYEGLMPACAAPTAPTALAFGTAGPSIIPASFTPNGTAPDGYMVVRYPTGSTETVPTDATLTYTVGDALGTGTISNFVSGSGSTFTVSGLSVSTTYDVYVYPYTLSNCTGGPVFGTALMGTNATSGCPSLAATINVGASETYTTLTALNIILAGCPITQNTLVVLKSDYAPASETYPIVFNGNAGSGAYTTTIQPDTAVSVTYTASSTSPLFDLSGTKNYIFDGRAGGSGSSAMTIHNTGNGAAMRLYNDAQNNIVEYITLKAANTSASNGVVRITSAAGATLSNGNNNNTITYCNIDGLGVSPNGIYTLGSTAPADNKSNIISNNNIYDYYSDVITTSNYGILLGGSNAVSASSAWTISGNSFYQTASRTYNSTAGTVSAIGGGFTPAGAYTITGNYIGGSSATNGGTAMTLSGSSSYVYAGMNLIVGGADASTISNNTVANINVTTTSTSTSTNSGLAISSIGGTTLTVTGNTIGSAAAAGAITFSGGSGAVFNGLNFGNVYASQTSQTYNITNNTIAGVAISGANSNSLTAITVASGNLTLTNPSVITGNTIGASSGPITNATAGSVTGISNTNAAGTNIATNTISNITSSSVATTPTFVGITTTSGVNTISGNTISGVSLAAASTGTTTAAAIKGIYQTSTTAGQVISNNTLHTLAVTGTATSTVTGIYSSGPTTGTNTIKANAIHSNNATTAASILNGIVIADAGNASVFNNQVRLGVDAAGADITTNLGINGITQTNATSNHSIYFNSIYIGGAAVGTGANTTTAMLSSATAGSLIVKNNIFYNARANGTGTGTNYAVKFPTNATLTINNNDYYTGATFLANYAAADVASFGAWQTATGQDASSISVDPSFIAPNGTSAAFDLHITAGVTSALESAAENVGTITTDYSGGTRPGANTNGGGLSSDIGAYEFDGIPSYSCTTPTAGATTATNTTICISGTTVASLSGSATTGTGNTKQWQSSTNGTTYTDIVGATGATYTSGTLTSNIYYQCVLTCAAGGTATSTPVMITVNNPTVDSTTPNSRCGTGTVALGATASAGATLNWYAAASGGSSLGTGTSFTTPSIATTTPYYVEASLGGSSASVGPTSPTAQGGTIGTQTVAWDVNFTVLAATTLQSVTIFPVTSGVAGTLTVRNGSGSGGTVISTINYTTSVSGGATAQVIPINVALSTGSYAIYTDTLPSGGISRNTTAAVYPYTSAVANITSNGFDVNYYMGLYNWQFSSGCSSARTLVNATVTAPPTLTISSPSATICAGTSTTTPVTVTSTVGDYDTYTWSPATVTGDATGGFTFTPVAASGLTTYTLTASNATCNNTTTFGVTVNPAPSFTASASPATICNGTISALSATIPAAANAYAFASTTGGSLETISSPTVVTTFLNGTADDGSNLVTPSPAFAFNYAGTLYSSFIAGTNGWLHFGSTATSLTYIPTSLTSTVSNAIYAFGRDASLNVANGGNMTHGHTTGGKYVFQFTNNSGGASGADSATNYVTMQVVLWGDSSASPGKIEIIYGTSLSTPATNGTIGIADTAGRYVNAVNGLTNSLTTTASYPASGTVYTFTPPVTETVTWSPVTDLYTNNTATTAYTALTDLRTVYAKPTSVGLTNYVATVTTIATSCSATQTVGVTVTALPTAPVAHDAHQCGAGVPAAYVTNPNTFVSVSAPVYNVYADNNPATVASYSTTTPSALSSISVTTTLYISIVSPDTGCESTRTAVTATVDTMPSATISYANTPFCSTTSTGTSVTFSGTVGGEYTASPSGLSIDASTGAIDPTTSTAGTYTVTYTMLSIGCGTQTATTSVTVNAAPNSSFSYSASSFCTSGGTASPTITGTAGTFTVSPSGLSLNATTGVINLAASAAGTYDITNTVSVAGCSNSVTTVTGVTITTAVNITTQPSSVSKLPGQTASFTVAATGTGTLTYQWQINTGSTWSDLSDSGVYSNTTTSTLDISDVTGLDSYQYRAIVTGTSPCAAAPSDAATLTVNTISFTLQPATQTICSDSGVTFSVTTTGGTPTTYHWQYRTSAIGTFADLADSATISGASTATLTISAGFGFTSANTGNQYRCVVDEYISAINSAVATLTVNDLPAFTTTLANQTVCTSAANVTFTANATGTGLTYQWEEYTAAVPTWTAISLATASTYVINSPTTALSGNQYRVVVTGLAPAPCNTPITSAAATLTVNQAVAIGTNPTAQVLCPTTTANFSVASVTGDGLAYQWYATNGGAPIALSNGATGSGATIAGATSASLSVATPLEFNNYSFYCVVSGIAPCSVATSTSASLTLYNNATYSIGAGGDFTNLTTAIAQLQTCGITQATTLELNASYDGANEPAYPVVLPAISGASVTNTLTIREASGVSGKVLNNATVTPTAVATIDMNAGTYWIIDGRVGGTGSTKDLQITNSNLSGTAIRFINDASYNTVKYVDISGVNNTITGGVVLFSTATTTGNDFNTVDNCNIRNAATTPVNGVYAEGTAAMTNDNNTLSNNNIYDYFNATLVTNGINVFSNSSAWTITGNRLYQSTNRIYTTGNTHRGINIATGEGYTVSGNVIGFANASGTGTTNMIGNSVNLTGAFPTAYTTTGTSNVTRYIAINAAFTAAGAVSNIQNNTIAGFALYTSSSASTTNGVFCGINVTSGNVNIGTTTGNTIGATSGNSSIYIATTTSGAHVVGIYTTSANTVAIQNNTFGAIDASGTSASTRGGFTGIDTAGAGNYSITNNTIGNADATNIRSGYFLSASNLTNNNGTATSTTGGTAFLMGIRSTMTGNVLAVTGNTLRGWNTSGTTTAVTGIITSGTMTGTTPSVNVNTNSLGTSSRDFMTYSFATSGALVGISCTNTVATVHNVNGNDIRGIVHAVAGSSAHTYITLTGATAASNVASVSDNTFTNLNVNTIGSVTFMSNSYTVAATGTQTINNNSIVTAFNKGGAGGTITLDTTSASSTAGAVINHTNNNFSNITVTGATTIAGWISTDGGTANKTYSGNTFSNWTGGSSSITAMSISNGGGNGGSGNVITGNTISSITSTGIITGLSLGASGTMHSAYSNTITGLSSTGTGGAVTGITNAAPTGNVYSNTINTLSSTSTTATVAGITSSGTTSNIYSNTINTLSNVGSTSGLTNGIMVTSGTTVKVYKNKVYDLLISGASTTLGAVNGMVFSGGTTVSAYNNLIGDLRATAINSSDAIRGMSVTSTTATTSYNLYNNTIYLNAVSSGTAFGTTGIYHSTSGTATTAKLDLQNNIVINTSTPGTTGVVTALRRSTAALTNFATTSNRNMYFAGTAAANKTVMYDGTNAYQTYGTYFTAVGATREANSFVDTAFTAAAFFTTTTGASSTYLQPNTGITTLAESGGNTQALFTDDFNGQTRPVSPGTAYDLGAWEFEGTTTAPSIVFTSVTPSTQQCTATARTIVADVTTAGGTISSVTLNYSYNGSAQTPVTMTLGSGSSYSGVILAPTTPVNATVSWSITAVNSLALSSIYTGTSYSDAPLTGVTAAAVATLATVCEGSPSVLSATIANNGTLGAGGTTMGVATTAGGASPFSQYYEGQHTQYLILASDLTSAGITAGNLTSMSFNISTKNSTLPYTGYSVKLGATATNSLSGLLAPTFTSVYTDSSTIDTGLSTVSGANLLTFGTGGTSATYAWDGTSNIVVDVCFANDPGSLGTYFSSNDVVTATTKAYTAYYGYYQDSSNLCGTSLGTVVSGSLLPVITFTGSKTATNISWATTAAPSTEVGTGNSLSVSPTTTTSYVATLTASGCTVASSPVTVTVNPTSVGGTVSSDQAICTGTAPASLTLTGNTGTVTKWQKSLTTDFASATDIAGTSTTLTGATIGSLTATTYFRAVVQSGSGIGACATANSAYATVTVNPTTVGGTVAGDQAVCSGSQPSTGLTLTGNTGTVVKWQKALNTSFTGPTDIASTSTTLDGTTIGSLTATTYFRAVVQSGACAAANSTNYVTVTVNTTVGGAVTGGTAVCSGSTSGLLTLADFTGAIVRWERSVSPFTTWTEIPSSSDLTTYTSGALTETTQFRAVINNSSCGEANATATTVAIESTTWDGTAWSNGSPSSVKAAIIAGNLTTAGSGAGNITACSLTVNAGYNVIVTTGDDFNISGAVNVATTATLTFNNNADLLQGTTATTNTNSGSITSKRNASMRRLEYVYWSAPVANQNLLAFSPLTLATRFYNFDEPSNAFVAIASPSTTTFGNSESQIAGKGFMIRAPNTFLDAPAAPQTFNGSFTGVPNNGTYTTPVSNSGTNHGYNLIGNPYPSPIDADMFLEANPGTLYFWTHAIIGSGSNNYASYTAAGATAAAANGATCNGTIQTGQGFLILTTTNGNATFTNAMRLGNNSGQFFKTATTEKHRIWLNLNSATTAFNQIMVGYVEGATQGVDTSIDGSLLAYGSSSLSSRIDNADYVIQGRSLPFASADTVPLGFNAAAAGEFTISIDHVDGLFLGSQDIYLKDNLLGITHNIKANPYTFTSASGVFNSRFEIVYTSSPLGTHNPTFDSESVVVYKQDQVLNVNSGATVMAKVRVFDVRGRLIFEKNNINATAVKLTDLKAEQQVLMVQITSDDNRIVTKKVVY